MGSPVEPTAPPQELLDMMAKYGLDGSSGRPMAPTIPTTQEPPTIMDVAPPTNPYAVTGWRKKVAVIFDFQCPSGQVVQLKRLERNDLFKLGVIDHLDTLLPLLIDTEDGVDSNVKVLEALKTGGVGMIDGVYNIADIVVMNCAINPMVTNNPSMAIESDVAPVVFIDDIDIDDKMAIFKACFQGEADQLKSVQQPTPVVEPVPAVPVVQGTSEPTN